MMNDVVTVTNFRIFKSKGKTKSCYSFIAIPNNLDDQKPKKKWCGKMKLMVRACDGKVTSGTRIFSITKPRIFGRKNPSFEYYDHEVESINRPRIFVRTNERMNE